MRGGRTKRKKGSGNFYGRDETSKAFLPRFYDCRVYERIASRGGLFVGVDLSLNIRIIDYVDFLPANTKIIFPSFR